MNARAFRTIATRPAVGMAAGTAASRATGLLRTVALAAALGVGTTSDAYNTANTAPNMLFALVAGGVLGSVLVPMLARQEDEQVRTETASVVLGTVTLWASAFALGMAVAAPLIMRGLAAGAGDRPDLERLLALGETWLRWFSPQVALYAISVVATGIMTARGRLVLGATAPVATNLLTIAAAIGFILVSDDSSGGREGSAGVHLLGAGTTVAVGAMALIQLWGARRVVVGLRFTPRLRDPVVSELRGMAGWMLLYVTANQLALAVVVAMASRAAGAVTAYQWAFMLMQLPYAVIAVSVFSAAYPVLARGGVSSTDLTALLVRPAVRAAAFLLPAAVGLWAVAPPLAAVVVGPGESSLVTAGIRGFSLSLVPFSLFQLLTRASYVRSDTRTPALVNLTVNATMLAVDVLVFTLADDAQVLVFGLAMGHASSYVVGCALLVRHLSKAGALRLRGVATAGLRTYVAGSAVMGFVLWALPVDGGTSDRLRSAVVLVLLALVGSGIYIVIAGRELWRSGRSASGTRPGPA